MKILILVGTSDNEHHPLMDKVQQETWDSIEVPDVRTIFYRASDKEGLFGNMLHIRGSEDRLQLFQRTMLAFNEVLDLEWDYLFRTDSSAYVNKAELVKVLQDKPKTKVYAGTPFHPGPMTASNFMWGEGFALSRDLVKHLTLFRNSKNMLGGEDYLIAPLLLGRCTHYFLPLYNYHVDPRPIPIVHLYRCRTTFPHDYTKEIEAMQTIHKQLTNGNDNH